MTVTLYTTHCPRCTLIAKKLQQAGIDYVENTDVKYMLSRGWTEVPQVEWPDGTVTDHKATLTKLADISSK